MGPQGDEKVEGAGDAAQLGKQGLEHQADRGRTGAIGDDEQDAAASICLLRARLRDESRHLDVGDQAAGERDFAANEAVHGGCVPRIPPARHQKSPGA